MMIGNGKMHAISEIDYFYSVTSFIKSFSDCREPILT
jgi:hypothetical protein